MNYLYKFVDKEIYVTPVEHEKVLSGMKDGKNLIVLRGGSLIMNMSLVALVAETQKDIPLTPDQERSLLAERDRRTEQRERDRLLMPAQKHTSGLPDIQDADDRICPDCNHIHNFPARMKACVACLKNYKT